MPNVPDQHPKSDTHMTDEEDPQQTFKLIVIGDSSVGKTSIIFQYCKGTFSEVRDPTVGGGYQPKFLQSSSGKIKLSIWDTAGQEKFRSLTTAYYRNVDGALLVYDISNPTSLERLASVWIPELEAKSGLGVERLIVGNKSDLREGKDSASFVSQKDGETFAKRQQAMFVETSAKTAQNVENAFDELVKRLLEKSRGISDTVKSDEVKITNEERGGGEWWCC
jgi:small GTP-binding protein